MNHLWVLRSFSRPNFIPGVPRPGGAPESQRPGLPIDVGNLPRSRRCGTGPSDTESHLTDAGTGACLHPSTIPWDFMPMRLTRMSPLGRLPHDLEEGHQGRDGPLSKLLLYGFVADSE